MISVNIELSENSTCPEYKSEGSAGADVFANLVKDLVIDPGKSALVPTGIRLEIPYGYEAQIRPRSGLALNSGVTVLNTPGTIDSDYRGEVKIILINLGDKPFTITHGMRIAQMIFARVYRGDFKLSKKLTETQRGEGGFGHTGT